MTISRATITLLTLTLASCGGPDERSIGQFRCNGDAVEGCNNSGHWYEVQDCSAAGQTSDEDWVACGQPDDAV